MTNNAPKKFRAGLFSLLATLFILVGFCRHGHAAPGSVDPSFGLAGKWVSDIGKILALAIQGDGKIVAVGNTQETNGARRFAVSRHHPNGAPDLSFGVNGKVLTDFSAGSSSANAVALQADGKIVVAGSAGDLFAMARYNTDGTLDQSFGAGGLLAARFEPGNLDTVSLASTVAIQADGKIVIGGDSFVTNPAAQTYVTATFDQPFWAGASFVLQLEPGNLNTVSPLSTVVRNPAAPTYVTDCSIAIARFNSDGTPDSSFGSAGIVTANVGVFDRVDALAIQGDGRIVVAGDSSANSDAPFTTILIRYQSDGTPDSSFGTGGVASALPGSFDVAALALQADGKIVIAGTSTSGYPAYEDFALARFTSDGIPDNSFGTGGVTVTDFVWTGSPSGDHRLNRVFSLALQSDGKIIIAGNSTSVFAVARYHINGALDDSFGAGGIALTQVNSLGANTFNFTVGSSSFAGLFFQGSFFSDSFLFSCTSCGVLLEKFLVEQPFALGIQANGKIIAGGVVDRSAVLVRFHGNTTPQLTVTNSGPGIGGIWSNDSAISCGSRCSAAYDAGTTTYLGWAAAVGSYFAGWTGCTPIAGGGCAATLNTNALVTATFDLDLPFTADTSLLPDAIVGSTYEISAGIHGGRLPIQSKVVGGSLPQGLSFSGRKILGMPLRSGQPKFTVDFTDAVGNKIRKRFQLTIFKALNIGTESLRVGAIGRSYNTRITATGGKGPFSWTILSGALPAGLNLQDVSGRVVGRPTTAGSYTFTVQLADQSGQRSEKTFILTVN